MITPIIETDRLILKRGIYEDFVKVYEYDMSRLRNINGEFEYVKQDPKNLIGYENYADEEDNCLDFIIYLKSDMQPIGNLTYDRYDEKNSSLEISCNLHPKYWNNKYMTEAIIESMKYIFNNTSIRNINYGFAEENVASKSLADKIGFDYNGSHYEYYKRLNKDIKEIESIMSKEKFIEIYGLKNNQSKKNI